MQYAVRSTQYAVRSTQYAVRSSLGEISISVFRFSKINNISNRSFTFSKSEPDFKGLGILREVIFNSLH
jgi:hypothetical protein